MDVVISDETSTFVTLLIGNGDGTFKAPSLFYGGLINSFFASADFNGDHHPDLLWQNQSTRQVVVWYMGGATGDTYLGEAFLDYGGQVPKNPLPALPNVELADAPPFLPDRYVLTAVVSCAAPA